jgi:hypothetical protein
MPIKMPIKKDTNVLSNDNKLNAEQRADEFIKAGGTVPKKIHVSTSELKNFNLKILESTLNEINNLRKDRPQSPYSKKSISLQNWLIEAIEEKLKRDKK